jgi:molybdenum-dependent DNA-binding transcriptional regulator ModE
MKARCKMCLEEGRGENGGGASITPESRALHRMYFNFIREVDLAINHAFSRHFSP